jgi:dipeptidase D
MAANPGIPVESLEPVPVWRFFAELSAVPRPSKHEEKARAYIRQTAAKYGFTVREDAAGNLVVDVPATPGCENAPVTVLQGHLDMVCEKNAGTQHDFMNDPLRLRIDADEKGAQIVRADGTTLGADNGMGLALAFAAATTPGVVHGPLELLCTSDEEMGMTSAKALDPALLRGRRMINLDSEEDNAVYIGCAGGRDTSLSWEFKTAPLPNRTAACRVTVSGLRGGHSGVDIHLNRGNAIKLLARVLRAADPQRLRLVEIAGGSKRNVIPREASAVVVGPLRIAETLSRAAAEIQAEAQQAGETGCTIRVEDTPAADLPAAIGPGDTQRLLVTLTGLPHGVLAIVPDIPGLVQTSNSTSTIESPRAEGKLRVTIGCLSRSSSLPELRTVARQLAAVGELAGATVESGNEYPGWQPNLNSPLLATCRRIYEQLYGAAPIVAAIHAGLECGLLGERVGTGTLDMVSFGPHIVGAHSPDERVYVASVQKVWQYLQAVLAELARA